MNALTILAAAVLAQGVQTTADTRVESPRDMTFELKLGPFKPLVDRESTLSTRPYEDTFGSEPMLLGEVEIERQFFQKFGSLAAGFSIGYTEKYGHARDTVTGEYSSEATSLQLVPMKLLAVYRWDYAAITWSVPLVPYVKGGFVLAPWWSAKGGAVETTSGFYGAGVKFGLAATFGLALQLDFLDPRLARDFDTSAGVNHSYIFAEYSIQEVNNFQTTGLDLSSRHWMFGLAFEF